MRKRRSSWIIILALCLAPGARGEESLPERETIRESYRLASVDGARLLVVDTLWGGIRVRAVPGDGAAGDMIRMTAVRTTEAESPSWRERAAREVRLEVSAEPGRLELFVDGPWRSDRDGEWNETGHLGYEVAYDFELEVPADVALDLKTVGRGTIELVGTRGPVRASNVIDDVRAEEIGGAARLTSVSGSVRGSFAEAPRAGSLFKTVSGDVEITFPGALDAELTLSARWGEIWSAFPLEPLGQLPAVERRRDGRLRIESNAGSRFRVGRGGAELRFETLSGEIRIGRAAAR